MTTATEALQLTHPEAEEAIITAAVFGDEDTLDVIAAQIKPEDFHNKRYGIIYTAIMDLVREVEPIDSTSILRRCRRIEPGVKIDEGFLSGLRGDQARALLYIDRMRELSTLRQYADFAFWFTGQVANQESPSALIAQAQEYLGGLVPSATSDLSFLYGWDSEKKHREILENRLQAAKEGVTVDFPWPWEIWNQRISHLRAGQLGLLAAPDGQGKSTYLSCIAEEWARHGKHVVLVHLEDDHEYKLDRRKVRYSGVPLRVVEGGQFTADQLTALRRAEKAIEGWDTHLHYYHAPGATMADITAELKRRVDEGVCDAVVLDYVDKVQATRGQARLYGSNSWERQANDIERFKSFLERVRVPGLTATQGNKSMQDGGTQTRKAIQGSGQKSHKSQLVIILTREIVTGRMTNSDGDVIAEDGEYSPIVDVRIDKQNRGATGQFRQFFDGARYSVYDLDTKRTELNE